MSEKNTKSLSENLKREISPKREADKKWYLDLLDDAVQLSYEQNHLKMLLKALKILYIEGEKETIREAERRIDEIRQGDEHSAETYAETLHLMDGIAVARANIEGLRHFFEEPYFARMDVQDDKEGYNAYYIGKKGALDLGIVDWRAPLSRRYYQKSQRTFSINEYDYEVVLRRAIRTKSGKVIDFRNEHLYVRDVLTQEEIGGKDREIVLDPFLREILSARKDEESVRDIIETIQEKQFEIITKPKEESFVLQGCAGSGKTMVLLHRLSYHMYNDGSLTPGDVLVITPSRSFNAFIDELSQVLELEKVSTITLQDYFTLVLQRAGVDIADKFNGKAETEAYLSYVYSEKFVSDAEKSVRKAFDAVSGLFLSEECAEYTAKILSDCKRQREAYTRIRNASTRIRRAVLGEIKEREEGGIYYTRPFRDFMNGILQVEDFLGEGIGDAPTRAPIAFYKQLRQFYHSGAHVSRFAESVVEDSLRILADLKGTIEKEIVDLKRYKIRIGGREELTYADRISAREGLLSEIESVGKDIRFIGEACLSFEEFFRLLQGEKAFCELGKSENTLDIVRYFYKLIVKKQKQKWGMTAQGLYASDAYALLRILALLGQDLYPRYALVFVDEGQDVSACEYQLLRQINAKAAFNVYGDLKQNITPARGVRRWQEAVPNGSVYLLNQNYRNTNQIVEYVRKGMDVDMLPIGFHGEEVQTVPLRRISAFFKDCKGLCAVIAKDEYIDALTRTSYHRVSEKGTVSKNKINILSVYESKGLEFGSVAVYTKGMSENEKYIACTRALNRLAIVGEG